MQLWQLGLLVGFGVALIVWLVHLSGGSRKAVLADAQTAIARFAEDFPTLAPTNAVLTKSGDAAFLALPDGKTGLVHALGDGFLTRILEPAVMAGVKADANRLSLRIADFTFPGAAYEMADSATARTIAGQLSPDRIATHA